MLPDDPHQPLQSKAALSGFQLPTSEQQGCLPPLKCP
jgi:hypothetical protein